MKLNKKDSMWKFEVKYNYHIGSIRLTDNFDLRSIDFTILKLFLFQILLKERRTFTIYVRISSWEYERAEMW